MTRHKQKMGKLFKKKKDHKSRAECILYIYLDKMQAPPVSKRHLCKYLVRSRSD